MKKLVLKTALITFACIIGLTALLFGIFALFFPKTLGNAFDKIGGYSASMHFYEKQYEKTQSLDDLYTLCIKVDGYNDAARAKEYLGDMVKHQDFLEFCKKYDGNNVVSTEEYLESKFVTAVYVNDGIEEAMNQMLICTVNGYTEFNPINMLYTDTSFDWASRKEDLGVMRNKIDIIMQTIPSTDHPAYTFACQDSDTLYQMING